MGAGTISEMKNLECIALFVEDLAASKKFYLEIFDLKIVYKDPMSARRCAGSFSPKTSRLRLSSTEILLDIGCLL
jgi:predicted enzyme related to lactoylglutathione lyase